MSAESDADRDVFFNTSEFGEGFTTSVAATFNGIFFNGSTDEDEVESSSPKILTKFSNVAAKALARDLSITRDSDAVVYKIREIEPDGTGMVTLLMEKQ